MKPYSRLTPLLVELTAEEGAHIAAMEAEADALAEVDDRTATLDFVGAGLYALGHDGADRQALQQAATLDAVGKIANAIKVDKVTDVAVRQCQFVQRDTRGNSKGQRGKGGLAGGLGRFSFRFGLSHGRTPGLGCQGRGGSLSPATYPGHFKSSPPFTLTRSAPRTGSFMMVPLKFASSI